MATVRMEKSLFVKLTNTISVLLATFHRAAHFGELIYRDKLSLAFAGDFYSVMFWIEVLLMLFPLVVLRVAKLRNDFPHAVPVSTERTVRLCNLASDLFAGGIQPGRRLRLLPDLGRTVDFYWFCGY